MAAFVDFCFHLYLYLYLYFCISIFPNSTFACIPAFVNLYFQHRPLPIAISAVAKIDRSRVLDSILILISRFPRLRPPLIDPFCMIMMMVGHTIGGDNDYDAVYDDDDDDVVVCDDGSSSSIKVDKVIAEPDQSPPVFNNRPHRKTSRKNGKCTLRI